MLDLYSHQSISGPSRTNTQGILIRPPNYSWPKLLRCHRVIRMRGNRKRYAFYFSSIANHVGFYIPLPIPAPSLSLQSTLIVMQCIRDRNTWHDLSVGFSTMLPKLGSFFIQCKHHGTAPMDACFAHASIWSLLPDFETGLVLILAEIKIPIALFRYFNGLGKRIFKLF